ncbi:MAG: hypothetical protein IKR57_03635 [Bacilli bacterium]|nr:hypothetical protein [Bacilli bacterium]
MEDFYNENFYLYDDEIALNAIEYRKRERLEQMRKELSLYRDTLEEYNEFLNKVVELLKSLDLSNSLEYSIALSYLIHKGYLSYNGNVDKKKTVYDIELISNPGINIVLGEGCCRNYSQIHKDVMDKLDIPSKKFYCVQSGLRIKKKGFEVPANHVANMINFDKRLYIIDCFNDARLYKMVSSYEAFIISHTAYKYFIYKPYYELIFGESDLKGIKRSYEVFKKDSKNRHLSAHEWIDGIRADTISYLDKNKKEFEGFSIDTKEMKEDIYNSLMLRLK